jgi:hypothetical protein
MPITKKTNPTAANSQGTSLVRTNFTPAEDNSKKAAKNQNTVATLVCLSWLRGDSIESSFDASRVVSMAVLTHDPAAFILDHEFGHLVTGQFAAALYRVGLSLMQRVCALGAVGLHGPASVGTGFNSDRAFPRHGVSSSGWWSVVETSADPVN